MPVLHKQPAGTARLGDKVWFEANADGIQDAGEPGVAGVTVTLYNSGGTAIGTTTTDANGYYQFINLAAGTYSVGFSNLPAGYSFTASTGTTSADATTNSDANPGTGRTTNFTILAAQSLQGRFRWNCGQWR
ncbi:MAG: carboxypeptidase regulatory-like domain-containing protein [Chitinophagaceae bacterium]|nr:carboxypeptidase regulatory-like domain-containing protein [Chitinophagaceae bacterium]